MALSLAAGRIVETETALTFADGIATRVPHPQAFAVMQAGLARIVEVADDEIARAILWLASDEATYSTGAILDAAGGR